MPRPTPGWKPRVPSGMVGCRGASGQPPARKRSVPLSLLRPFRLPAPVLRVPAALAAAAAARVAVAAASRKVLFSLNAAADAHCE